MVRCTHKIRATGLAAMAVLTVSGVLPAVAVGTQVVTLNTQFIPDKFGASTTIVVNVALSTTGGEIPPPLTDVTFRLPAGMGLATTTLGLSGCSSNAVMGFGKALVDIPIGPELLQEVGHIIAFMGPPQDNHTAMLFFAQGSSPVSAELVFEGRLLPDTAPFGQQLNAAIPLTSTLPGAPNAALVRLQMGIGPRHLTYYKDVNGRTVRYRPIGMTVPTTCPRGGFPSAAEFSFEDGTHVTAKSAVPCPQSH
jgi:hypothetical protein